MPGLSQVCRRCVADGVPRRSLIVALFVGTLLNLINQGDTLLSGEHINLVKLLLTYIVPYGVATYGAVSFRLTRPRNASRPRSDGSTEKSGQ